MLQVRRLRTRSYDPHVGICAARRGLCGVLTGALLLSGCATTHENLVAFAREHEAEVATGSYVVRPPDTIAIHSPTAPELDGAQQMVRSDGKIVLRLIGEVDVAGLTTVEIADKLRAQLARYYVEPEIAVEVSGYNSQFYYVFGEVASPGPVRFTGHDTVLLALAEARPNFFAWRGQIRVTRPARDGEAARTIIVDLDKMLAEGDMSMNVLLQEGDVIEVPPTPLAWIGHRVREVLYPVEPVIQAYNGPASVIHSTQTYGDTNGNNDNGSHDNWQRRFGR